VRDSLGAAVAVAGQLPDAIGEPVLRLAREAFVAGMQLTAVVAAAVAVALAVLTVVGLREPGEPPSRPERDEDERHLARAPRFEPAES
jgi:DHA2 family multidrug resistance protein-like MFS transporter